MASRKEIHNRIHLYSAMLFAFTLPVSKMMQLFIIFLMLNWIVEGDFVNKFKTIFRNKLALIFIVFYLIHAFGLLYTENMSSGLFDIQIKLCLLFFPLIFCSRPFTKDDLKHIMYAFIAGALVSSSTMLGVAGNTYMKTGENHFFYEAFSFFIHPSYFSMYLNFSIVWIIFNLLNKENQFIGKPMAIFFILFFSCIVVLLSSKLGLITWILIVIGFMIYYIVSRRKYVFGFIGLTLISIAIFLVTRFVPEISGRIGNAIEAVTSSSTDNTKAESTAVRMLVWKASNAVIKKNWISGVGTGDAKDELMKEYNKEGMTGALKHNLNCHNEFYQVTVSLGIFALLILLLHLFLPFQEAWKKKNAIYMLFILIIIINFLTESMFETQAGVMFFAFFNSILCFSTNNEQITTS